MDKTIKINLCYEKYCKNLFQKNIMSWARRHSSLTENLDTSKRPISAVADNFEVRNAKTIKIQANKKISFELLYDKNNSLHKKIKIEQTRKETSNNSNLD